MTDLVTFEQLSQVSLMIALLWHSFVPLTVRANLIFSFKISKFVAESSSSVDENDIGLQ